MNSAEGIDGHIAKMIEGKDSLSILTALKKDLMIRDGGLNFSIMDRWDEIYYRFPSCKHLMGDEGYEAAMIDKYIKTYRACLAELEQQLANK